MLDQAAIAALNHLLEGAPWARQKLTPFAGRTARLTMSPLRLNLAVTSDGRLAEAAAERFDVEVELPAHAPLSALRGSQALMGYAQVSGSADFAEALGAVLRDLRWDVEEDLSYIVGDVVAHRIVGSGRRVMDWQRRAGRNAAENVVEYLQHERAALPSRRLASEFADAVDTLRDDLARLEKRIERLAARRDRVPGR